MVRRLLLLGTLLITGCKVGPNFEPPHEPVPEHYEGAQPAARAPAAHPDETVITSAPASGSFWWREFHDAELDRLIDEVTAGNVDLQVASVRILEARLEVLSARAQGLPSLNASASFNREQLGAAGVLKATGASGLATTPQLQQFIAGIERPINLYQIGFDASWELDLFGRVRRSVEAASAQSAGAVESRNDLLVSLQAEAASDYLQLRAAQVLEQVTLQEIGAQRQLAELTQDRHVHGLETESAVDSARAQLASLEAELPSYRQTIVTSRHALAVLSGADPETLADRFASPGDLPEAPAQVPVDLPSTLARRRPDIRSAEAALHAATAQVGVSVASLFPDISFNGSYGFRNIQTGYLFESDSKFYTINPSISLPIFRGGQLVASVRISKAQAVEAALDYRKAVLNALQEVEDALTSLAQDSARVAALLDEVSANQRALSFYLDAFRHGLTSYINVLTVELQLIQARAQLAQALLTQRTDLVRLFKALGGGWQSAPAPQGDARVPERAGHR